MINGASLYKALASAIFCASPPEIATPFSSKSLYNAVASSFGSLSRRQEGQQRVACISFILYAKITKRRNV